jgi:uncharacterized membrane protein YsdA (DUF1294 family)
VHPSPHARFGALGLVLASAGAVGLAAGPLRVDPLLAWLIAVSVVTFVFYGYDKRAAEHTHLRVPERVLLGLGAAGGTLGALAGMRVFRHKTAKTSFRLKFVLLTILQAVATMVYFRYR